MHLSVMLKTETNLDSEKILLKIIKYYNIWKNIINYFAEICNMLII